MSRPESMDWIDQALHKRKPNNMKDLDINICIENSLKILFKSLQP